MIQLQNRKGGSLCPITLKDVRDAKDRIAPYIRKTDIAQMTLPLGGEAYVKLENLQYTGAFKVRGAFKLHTAAD